MLVLLAAAYVPLRDPTPSTVRVLASNSGTIGSRSAAVTFKLASDQTAVVSATLSNPSPGANAILRVVVDGDTEASSTPLVPPSRSRSVGVGGPGASVDDFRPAAANSVAASVVLHASRVTSYRAELVADGGNYQMEVTSVHLIKLGAADKKPTTVHADKFAVAVGKDAPVVVTVDARIEQISGARVLALAGSRAVIRADEAGYALFSLQAHDWRSSVTVRPAPERGLDGGALNETAGAALLHVPEVVPRAMALELICREPIGVAVLDASFGAVTPTLSAHGLYDWSDAHVYVLANLPSGGLPKIVVLNRRYAETGELSCDVRTASLSDLGTVGEASGAFEREVHVAADQGATGFLLRTTSDSVVIVDVPLALRPSLSCKDEDSENEIGGKRLTMLVTGERTCVLLLVRSDLSIYRRNYTSSPSAMIRIVPLPGIGTERPRA